MSALFSQELLIGYLVGVIGWFAVGQLVVNLYRAFLEYRYPAKKWNGGFFFYLVGHAGSPVTLAEHLASFTLRRADIIMSAHGIRKTFLRIMGYGIWWSDLGVLYLYQRFCKEKATAKNTSG